MSDATSHPYAVEVEPGQTYYWCRCGRSRSQPFCDGSHKDTEFTPLAYQTQRTRIVWFCGCKQSSEAPLCDGTHKEL